MASHRLAALLGPLIAALLLAGVVTVVVRAPAGDDAELAEGPDQTEPAGQDATDGPDLPEPGVQAPDTDAGDEEPTAPDTDAGDGEPTAPDTTDSDAEPTPPATAGGDGEPTAEPSPSATADSDGDEVGGQVAVDDPTALTGGWRGGTPNTGTSLSAVGLPLLVAGGALLWLRRSRA